MTNDDLAAQIGTRATPRAATERPDVLTPIRELLIADEAATVLIGIDGTPIDAQRGRRRPVRDPARAVGRRPAGSARRARPGAPAAALDPEGGVWRGEIDLPAPFEGRRSYACTVLVRHDVSSRYGGYIAVLCRDITDERLRSAQMLHLLEHDATTGLLNRSAALERTAAALRDAGALGGEVAVLLIDVDRLRDVNDALGHDIGDRLLVSTAKRLGTAVRPDDVVARLGGDEFLRDLPRRDRRRRGDGAGRPDPPRAHGPSHDPPARARRVGERRREHLRPLDPGDHTRGGRDPARVARRHRGPRGQGGRAGAGGDVHQPAALEGSGADRARCGAVAGAPGG